MNIYSRITNVCVFGLLAGLPMLIMGNDARAEGSKNLTPGITIPIANGSSANDHVGYLQTSDGLNTGKFLLPGGTDKERLYVHMLPGDTLFYGVRRRASNDNNTVYNDLRLRVMENATTSGGRSNILRPTSPGTTNNWALAPGAGVISSYAEAAAGPRYKLASGQPSTGYNPLYYVNTGAERDVWVEFAEVNDTNTTLTTQHKSWYNIWDFTVRNRTEKNGRVYSHSWGFTGGAADARLANSFSLYPLIPNPNHPNTYFIKRVDYAGMQPFGVLLTANSYGVDQAASGYKEQRKSKAGSFSTAEYKLFVNDPDPTVYLTTTRPAVPTISTSCRANNRGAIFTLQVDQAGFGIIFIDGNNNKTYEAATDRLLEGLTAKGNNTFDWDGTSDTGATMPSGNISITYSSGVGPVNFPIFDAENNTSGIVIREVRPGNIGNVDYAFWDDIALTNFPAPKQNPYGINSTDGAHKWSQANTGVTNPGDNVTVNTYAVGLLARNQSNNITYNNGSCLVIAPVVLPVELTRFTAAVSGPQVLVRWETASEKNSASFLVERSADGRTFEAIGQVRAQGNSTNQHAYSFTDPTPGTGQLYYRLRQLDLDQTAHFSPVVVVQLAIAGTLYPNPATSEVMVRLAAPTSGPLDYAILNAAGQIVQRGQLPATTELRIPVAELPTNGLYLLRVSSASTSSTYRFTK